jgi:glyoxylase-like metal-dependent hydrolase (beta-lactamase superfamily II)
MKVTAHGNNLFQLSYYGFVNCYLVREDDGFTLVDAAVKGCGKAIVQAAQKLDRPIVRLLLTHAHVDHVGALDELHALLPQAEVLITTRDARFMAGDMRLDANEPVDKLRGGWPTLTTRPTRTLSDGDRVGSLEVVTSPGHTPGHASFLDTRDRGLIAGDAFQTLGGVAVSGTWVPLFPLPAMSTWHKPTCLESGRKLRALAPTWMAVGHGRVLQQPLAAMDRAIAALDRELERKEQSQVVLKKA